MITDQSNQVGLVDQDGLTGQGDLVPLAYPRRYRVFFSSPVPP